MYFVQAVWWSLSTLAYYPRDGVSLLHGTRTPSGFMELVPSGAEMQWEINVSILGPMLCASDAQTHTA